jgi:hypothetical protein
MNEIWQRIAENFVHRLDGPLHFRFIVQPLMAIVFATLDGLKDARLGKPAYLWTVVSCPEHRRELLHDGWKHFGKIFILGLVLDLVYQLKVHHMVYPGELLLTALILAVLPYLLLRGPVNRIARLFKRNA